MLIIVIDTSHNTSPQMVKTILRHHSNADIIYTFDYQFCEYHSTNDLWSDLRTFPDNFFNKPCAFYDMITAILSHSKIQTSKSVTIFSSGIDECSRLSNEKQFNNYIYHFNKFYSSTLKIVSLHNESILAENHTRPSTLNLIDHLIELLKLD